MLRRILNFDKHDLKHINTLLRNFIVQLFKGNILEAKEALYWFRIHITYDSKRVKMLKDEE